LLISRRPGRDDITEFFGKSLSRKPDPLALLRPCDSALKQGFAEVCQTDAARYGVAVVGETRVRSYGRPAGWADAGGGAAVEAPQVDFLRHFHSTSVVL
jgi:hypothetical protein